MTHEALAREIATGCDHVDHFAADPGKWEVNLCTGCVMGLLVRVEAEALERAATIADSHDEAPAPGTIDTGAIWRGASARTIAAAIRALATKEE